MYKKKRCDILKMIKQIGGINILSTNENIVNNLKYLGLDLENVPNSIKEFVPLDYRPSKFNDEHNYKVYKYVNVEDIQILLTPTNRLCDISEKYR